MGLTNPDSMIMNNGCQLSNCYLSFTPGPTPFNTIPITQPLTFSRTVDTFGSNHFFANGTVYIYLDQVSKETGLCPIQTQFLSIPADASSAGVYSVFYAALQSQYPNGVVDSNV